MPIPVLARARHIPAVALLCVAATAAQAQPAAPATRVDSLPLAPTRHLRFTTDEGTWMSLDVSPDGRTLVFDLLGDLHTLPEAGGTATRITSGTQFDAQPRWSPDGRAITCVSDRSGADNVWIAAVELSSGDERQWLVMAAREEQLTPTAEGTSDFKMNLTLALDGYAGVEHELSLTMIHGDGVKLLAESGLTYTPTLIVTGAGLAGEHQWYRDVDVHGDAKLRRFLPQCGRCGRGRGHCHSCGGRAMEPGERTTTGVSTG